MVTVFSVNSRACFRASRRHLLPLSAFILSALCTVLLFLVFALGDSSASPLPSISRPRSSAYLLTATRSAGYKADYCAGALPTNFLRSSNRLCLLFLFPTIIFTFVGLALVTDDYFVPALERICNSLQLSADVAGATFMAAGSSAPELFTSILSVFFTGDDLGIGTVVGSAVFNILIIIALSAVLANNTLTLDFRPLLRDSLFYVFSVVALLVIVLGSTKGRADWWEGLVLLCMYGVYMLFMKFGNKPYFMATERWVTALDNATLTPGMKRDAETSLSKIEVHEEAAEGSFGRGTESIEVTENTTAHTEVENVHQDFEIVEKESEGSKGENAFLGVKLPTSTLEWVPFPLFFPWKLLFLWTIVPCDTDKTKKYWPLTFTLSILWIMAASYAIVECARLAGCFIGIPSSIMGLTVLAAGTSVPDALASVAVAKNGFGDMAVSNAIGSNVFDILLGLGLPWFVGGLAKKKALTITVDPAGLVVIPIAILFGTIILLVSVLALAKRQLSKQFGYFLVGLYALFLTYSILDVYVFKIGRL